jgi:hypothetical protein
MEVPNINLTEIHPVRAVLINADSQQDIQAGAHDKDKMHFSQLCEHT